MLENAEQEGRLVVHVIIGLNVGGAESMLKRLVVELRDEPFGFRHKVVSLSSVGIVGRQLLDLGVDVHALGLNGILSLPRTFWRLTRLLRKLHPDIVQTWMYHADLIGGIAARAVGIRRVVWGVRNTDIYSGKGLSFLTGGIVRICALLSSHIPTLIVCVAESAKKSHIKIGYADDRMSVIENGFEVQREKSVSNMEINQYRATLGIPVGVKVIASVGRFNYYKDHENFISSMGVVISRFPDTIAVLAGRDVSAENEVLQSWALAANCVNNCRFVGETDAIDMILTISDVYCLHSLSEGFPNVVGEAMSAGVPCVVTDVGDTKRLLGDAGIVVEPRNSRALASGLISLLAMTPEARNEMGKMGSDRIKDEFSIKLVSQRYVALYMDVLQK